MRRRMRELLRSLRTTGHVQGKQAVVMAAGSVRIVELPSPVQFVDWLLNGESQE